ncbi:MAG: phosphotransferase [Haloarculaceae archaeon]
MEQDRALVARVFPDRVVESVSASDAGNSKRTVAVWFADHDPVVLQYSTETSLRTEGELARAIRDRTAVPVPRVIETGSHGDSSYVVSELAPGDNLHSRFAGLDRPVQVRISREFGRYLAEIHDAFAFDGVGPVVAESAGDGTRFRTTEPVDFETWFRRYAQAGIDALPEQFDRIREQLEDAIRSVPREAAGDRVLYPWDLRPGNALLMNGELSAVLDWGDPLAAPPGLAVAKTDYVLTDWYVADAEPLQSAFREGYESVRDYPDVPPVFRLVAVLRSAVDSRGVVTRPRYPEWTGEKAVQFHLDRLQERLLVSNRA